MELHPEWRRSQNALTREWTFKNFKGALAFVNTVGAIAEELKHHPDIQLGWGYVKLSITTHDAGHTLTDKDFTLAGRIDQLSS